VTTKDGQERDAWIRRATCNLADAWEYVAQAQDGRCDRWPGAGVSDLGSACPFLNNATLDHPLDDVDAAEFVGRLDGFYSGQTGGSSLLWTGYPTSDLSRLGSNFWGEPPLMVRPPGGAAPSAASRLRIVEARDASMLADFERVLVDGYPAPWLQPCRPACAFDERVLGGPWRFWVGYADDRPVSCSAAYTDADVVGVFMVATLPDARGHGYGTALTWAATVAAPELPAVLLASDDGRPVYERLGYEIVSRFALWERPRAAMSGGDG
jgi:GNAT superfamily N-acetyltransferase